MASPGTYEDRLNSEAFTRFLSWLDSDRDAAGQRYRELHRRLIKVVANRGCEHPEEAADEAIDRVILKIDSLFMIPEGKRIAYIQGVANNVVRERARARLPPRKMPPRPESPEEREERERKHACLEHCLSILRDGERELILKYYGQGGSRHMSGRRRLADEAHVSPVALRKQTQRIRERIRECVSGCMARASGLVTSIPGRSGRHE
jgi:DNA-directed RNA polymerase specialized sigma24 family protein